MESNATEDKYTLPTLPVILAKIFKLIDNPKSTMKQISMVVMQDVAIATKVIKLINSVYYGLTRNVSSIQEAITMLGLNTVKNIVTGVSIVHSFRDSHLQRNFNYQEFWKFSIHNAVLSETLAKYLKIEKTEDYYLAGLLRNLGYLILNIYHSKELGKALAHSQINQTPILAAEKKVMGFNHFEVGAHLCKKWNFPPFIAEMYQYNNEDYNENPIGYITAMVSAINFKNYSVINRTEIELKNLEVEGIQFHAIIPEYELVQIQTEVDKNIKTIFESWGIK